MLIEVVVICDGGLYLSNTAESMGLIWGEIIISPSSLSHVNATLVETS